MKELCVRLGPGGQLSGIACEPATTQSGRALLLLSAGLLPKHGPFRLYAEISRKLAHEGFASLRFDLGGVGDSRVAHPSLPLMARTQLEIRAAVDHLCERYGPSELTLAGLCSGAEDAFRYAENDPRVTGVLMIDPFAYRTPGWHWRHGLRRARRFSRRMLGTYRPPSLERGRALIDYKYMAHDESNRIIKTLLGRKTRLHFIYTGGMDETFNHAGQLQAMFPELELEGKVALDHLPELDHTQLLEADRQRMIETIVRRLIRTESR